MFRFNSQSLETILFNDFRGKTVHQYRYRVLIYVYDFLIDGISALRFRNENFIYLTFNYKVMAKNVNILSLKINIFQLA